LWKFGIQRERVAIRRECLTVAIRHLQRVAEPKAGERIIGSQLGNNGGERDGVIVTPLYV
jgi:hypothetical protein